MKKIVIKVLFAMPVYISLMTLLDRDVGAFVGWCFGVTSYLIASAAVDSWGR